MTDKDFIRWGESIQIVKNEVHILINKLISLNISDNTHADIKNRIKKHSHYLVKKYFYLCIYSMNNSNFNNFLRSEEYIEALRILSNINIDFGNIKLLKDFCKFSCSLEKLLKEIYLN